MVKFWIDDGSDYICVNMLKDEGIDGTLYWNITYWSVGWL